MDKVQINNKWLPALYATFYPMMAEAARKCGYALALHGSLVRDCDIIAVPWIEEAEEPVKLIDDIAKTIGVSYGKKSYAVAEEKPHGRIAYVVHFTGGGYFDISVIPPKR